MTPFAGHGPQGLRRPVRRRLRGPRPLQGDQRPPRPPDRRPRTTSTVSASTGFGGPPCGPVRRSSRSRRSAVHHPSRTSAVSTFGRLDMAYDNAGIQAPPCDAAGGPADTFDLVEAADCGWPHRGHAVPVTDPLGSATGRWSLTLLRLPGDEPRAVRRPADAGCPGVRPGRALQPRASVTWASAWSRPTAGPPPLFRYWDSP